MRSHRKFQNSHSSCGHSFLYVGQALMTIFFSRLMVWPCACSPLLGRWGWIWSGCYIVMSSPPSHPRRCVLLSRGTLMTGHQRLGLIYRSWTWTLNRRRLRSSLCNRLGVSSMFCLKICSKGKFPTSDPMSKNGVVKKQVWVSSKSVFNHHEFKRVKNYKMQMRSCFMACYAG